MSSSKKTTDSTSNTNYASTSTPNVPTWIADPDQQYMAKVQGLIGKSGSDFVAPASSNQTLAFKNASNLGGWQDTLKTALGQVGQATSTPAPTAGVTNATAAQIAPLTSASATTIKSLLGGGGWQDYMNPELQAVINPTMANLSISQGGDQAALDAAAGLNKAFGGSGFALQKSNLTNSQELGRATTEAGLRSNAFDKAAALAGTDAGLLTNTSQFNSGQANARATAQAGLDTGVSTTNSTEANKIAMANQDSQNQAIKNLLAGAGLTTNIGNSQAANDQNDVQAQLAAGGVQRGIDGDQRAADLNMLTAIRQLLGFDPSQFIGQSTNGNQNTDAHQTVTTTPSTLDTIGKIAGLAATAFGVPGGGGFQSLFNSGGGGGIPKFNGGVPTDNSFGDFG